MKIEKITCLLLFICLVLTSVAQNEFSKWYFGYNAALDFSTSPPLALTNGLTNTNEGVATICDSGGNLLFYTDGVSVFNSINALMANGNGLFGDGSSTQSAIIVKKPGSSNIYYIFTTPAEANANGARYSIVNTSLAAGLGSVTVKNSPLYTSTCEKLVAVQHCNGIDVWIVTHDYMSNNFRSFLLNSIGVSPIPIISSVGQVPIDAQKGSTIGQLKISPDNKKLAMAVFQNSDPPITGKAGFYLFDFNPCSGTVSNSLTLINIPQAYSIEFSPDGTKLYGVQLQDSYLTSVLFQWNICSPFDSIILASQYSINMNTMAGSAQWAKDGKIYLAAFSQQSLHVINNPNASGAAINFSLNALSIAPNICGLGLPNYIHTIFYTKFPIPPFTHTVACQTASFSLPPPLSFTDCPPATYPPPPTAYFWNFGEPSSGSSNTSTLANPVHTYSTIGSYSVSLILYSPAVGSDTVTKIVSLMTPGPVLNVTGNFTICNGDLQSYTVSGANIYSWFNNSTATTITLAPHTNSIYSVSGSLNNCTVSKSFTISVDPCTGISNFDSNRAFSIFPNPFTNILSVEATTSSQMIIFDLSGELVSKNTLDAGHNEIKTSELKAGVYFMQAKNGESVWRGRFVKVE